MLEDIEENSNRSLFKISEESLHGNSNLHKHSKENLKASIKSKTPSKHSTSNSKRKHCSNSTSGSYSNSSRTKNSKPSSSTTACDDQTTKSSICLTSNNTNNDDEDVECPPSNTTISPEDFKPRKIENPIVSFNHYEEIRKKSRSPQENEEPIVHQPGLRRAQSELTFDLFEKLVKKAQINFSNRSNTSDFEDDDFKPKTSGFKCTNIFISLKNTVYLMKEFISRSQRVKNSEHFYPLQNRE